MPKQAAIDTDGKTSKSKKASLPAGAVLNTALSTEAKDTPHEDPKPEKDGWNIEALFGSHEQKSTPDDAEISEPLTDDEARDVIQDYVEDRADAVDAELADDDDESPLAEIVSANQVLLDKLREQAAQSEKPADAIIEEATQSTIQELHLVQNEADAESHPALHDAPEQPLRTTIRHKEAAINSILAEETPEEPNESAPPAGPLPPPRPPRTEHSAPEPSPEQPFSIEENATPLSDDLAREVHAAHSSHEAQPVTARPKHVEQSEHGGFTRSDVAKGVLVGGVAGYMIGRHSGRKHAEAKARPVQAEMTKEIASLQQKIAQNEQVVRSLAAQKTARSAAEAAKPQPAYQGEKFNAQWSKPAEATTKNATNEAPVQAASNEVVVAPLAVRAPKTNEGLASQHPEPNKEKVPAPARVYPNQEQVRAVRPIEKLSIEDILILAKTVKVEGKTLDTYYKQGQLTEVDVRKILIEHRRTGRPERAFYKQINTHERQRAHNTVEMKPTPQSGRSSGSVLVSQSADTPVPSGHSSQTFTEAMREVHALPADKIHAENTPRVSATLTVGIVVLIVFAFFLVQIIFT